MTERAEETVKALRRAFREFTEKVGKMGNVDFKWRVDEIDHGSTPKVEFSAWAEVEE